MSDNMLLIVGGTIVAIVAIAAVFFLGNGNVNQPRYAPVAPSTTSVQISTGTVTLYDSGFVETLQPGAYSSKSFTVPSDAISIYALVGSFTSSANIDVAIMTPEQYGAFTANHNDITSAVWSSTNTQGTTLDISPGNPGEQYYIVFYNPNFLLGTDTVTVVDKLYFGYTYYGTP